MDLDQRRLADTVVVTPEGRVDHTSADAFRAALAVPLARCSAAGDRLVLDLSRLEYVSSAGLRVLMLAAREAQARGGTLVVAALQPVVREVFEITRFTAVFQTFATLQEALAQVSPAALAALEGA
jgi:anti-sigma B factor antagonist/stage II sporulation protein AA (anti-sigma F factor antagonist)